MYFTIVAISSGIFKVNYAKRQVLKVKWNRWQMKSDIIKECIFVGKPHGMYFIFQCERS